MFPTKEGEMYCIVCPMGIRRITSDARLIEQAFKLDWKIWHNGNRIW